MIVRPDVARIYRQDVSCEEWMNEGPRVDFFDIPSQSQRAKLGLMYLT